MEQSPDGMSEYYRISQSRSIPSESNEAFFARSFHMDEWNRAYLDWSDSNSDAFAEACLSAFGAAGDPTVHDPMRLDSEAEAATASFLDLMHGVAKGTYFETWEDVEFVVAGERLCWFLAFEVQDDQVPQWFAELRTEVVYQPIFDSNPLPDGEEPTIDLFQDFMSGVAGPSWEQDVAEVRAALTFGATTVLCPDREERALALIREYIAGTGED